MFNNMADINSNHSSDLVKSVTKTMIQSLSSSLSTKTWANYKTAVKHFKQFSDDMDMEIVFPLPALSVTMFCSWMFQEKGVTSKTINKYLSGLAMWQSSKIDTVHDIRAPLVKQCLKGLANLPTVGKQIKSVRVTMTWQLLQILADELNKSSFPDLRKTLIWAVSTIAFFGSFRISELLSATARKFDSDVTLCTCDVRLANENMEIPKTKPKLKLWIKNPKVGSSFFAPVYSISQKECCPVIALKEYTSLAKMKNLLKSDLPLFRKEDGNCYTPSLFNLDVRKLLCNTVDYDVSSISSHSFRAAIPSLLKANGVSDEDVKLWGRWSSKAFLLYCRLQETQRSDLAGKLQRCLDTQLRLN